MCAAMAGHRLAKLESEKARVRKRPSQIARSGRQPLKCCFGRMCTFRFAPLVTNNSTIQLRTAPYSSIYHHQSLTSFTSGTRRKTAAFESNLPNCKRDAGVYICVYAATLVLVKLVAGCCGRNPSARLSFTTTLLPGCWSRERKCKPRKCEPLALHI